MTGPAIAGHGRLAEDTGLETFDPIREMGTSADSWNTRTTVHTLPNEVLTRIFILCAPSDSPYRVDEAARFMDLMRCTHVCTRWRAVALGYPLLWSTVVLHYPRWAPEMISRSKQLPLTIWAREPDARAAPLLAMEMYRVQQLFLDFSNAGSPHAFHPLLDHVGPALETFRLWPPSHFAVKVSEDMFKLANRLRHIDIYGLSIASLDTALEWGQLRVLRIQEPQPLDGPDLVTLLSALQCSPRLELFSLTRHKYVPLPVLDSRKVPLHCLTDLVLHGPAVPFVAFMRCLSLSPISSISLEALPDSHLGSPADWGHLILHSKPPSRASQWDQWTITVDISDCRCHWFIGPADVVASKDAFWVGFLGFPAVFGLGEDQQALLLIWACTARPTRSLSGMRIASKIPIPAATWSAALVDAISMQEISLRGPCVLGFLEAYESFGEEDVCNIPLPLLHELTLRFVDFCWCSNGTMLLDLLCLMLETRERLGRKLATLRVRSPANVPADAAARLSALVVNPVSWECSCGGDLGHADRA